MFDGREQHSALANDGKGMLATLLRLLGFSVPTALLAAYYAAIVVWARDSPWAPMGLTSRVFEICGTSVACHVIGASVFGSSVAGGVFLAVVVVTTLTGRFTCAMGTRSALGTGLCTGLGYALGVVAFHAVPGSFVDSIPGYTMQAWCILIACGLAGTVLGVVITRPERAVAGEQSAVEQSNEADGRRR